jgi:drug/metabolite transporter (DMT)-like permease
VTALWNTNAFFAYVLTVKLFGLPWEPRRLAAVLLATAGAAAVVYGSSSGSETPSRATAGPLVGDILTLVASVLYGIYQVGYKMYAALPTDPHEIDSGVDASYEPITSDNEDWGDAPPSDKADMVYPPPFGLYANFLTACIGACTFLLLCIPFPILHLADAEKFRVPTDITTILTIAGISLSGVVFNAGLMVFACFPPRAVRYFS